MRNFRWALVLLMFAAISNACTNSETNEGITHFKVKGPLQKVKLSDLFDAHPKVVSLETNKASLMAYIISLEITKEHIYILDSNQSLFCFDSKGNYIRKIKPVGKGPGDFLVPITIGVNSDDSKLYVYDAAGPKIVVYNNKLMFIEEMKLPFGIADFKLYGDKIALYRGFKNGQYTRDLYFTDLKLNREDSFVNVIPQSSCRAEKLPLVSSVNNTLLFRTNRSDTIYSISKEGVSARYKVGFGQFSLPPAHYYKDHNISDIYRSKDYLWGYVFNAFTNGLFLAYIVNEKQFIHVKKTTGEQIYTTDWVDDFGLGLNNDIYGYLDFKTFTDDCIVYSCTFNKDLNTDKNLLLHQQLKDLKPNDNPALVFLKLK